MQHLVGSMLVKLKYWIKKSLYLSNRESNSLLALILFILLLIIAPKVVKLYYRSTTKPLDHSADIALLENNLSFLQKNALKFALIDINRATAEQLQTIEGITDKLSIRIVRYREKLGGFVSSGQYKEIYHLSKPLQVRLMQCTAILTAYRPKRLSLNQANFKALVCHPYISAAMARAIIDYRKRNGKFNTLRDIEKLPGYHTNWGRKIMPYLAL